MGSDAFKALGDPTRRRILEILGKEGDQTAGEIASRFAVSAPTISHHLGILKAAGLVQDEHRRQSIVYSLNTTVFQEVVRWMYDLMQEDENSEKE